MKKTINQTPIAHFNSFKTCGSSHKVKLKIYENTNLKMRLNTIIGSTNNSKFISKEKRTMSRRVGYKITSFKTNRQMIIILKERTLRYLNREMNKTQLLIITMQN